VQPLDRNRRTLSLSRRCSRPPDVPAMNAPVQMTSPSAVAPDLAAMLDRLRAAQAKDKPDYAQRMDDLARLRAAYKSRIDDFVAAMSADFGRRSRHESLLSDVFTVLTDIDHTRAHLRQWMKPTRKAANGLFWPARGEWRYQPLGVIGVISPWNYPVNLALMPVASAIAAGNAVMLKPSEHTPRTSALLAELLAGVFPDTRVAVALGDADVAARFAALPFDHILFTGSTAVGRRVLMAAAPNLTPVTLELGGKTPVIVADGYPLSTAAARIAAGKLFNGGQTCAAPDYVLLPRAQIQPFVALMRDYVERHYPDLAGTPDYTSVVNDRQFQRLAGYLEEARAAGAEVIELAKGDPARRVFAPTLVLDAPESCRLLQEEIFGPILPIVASETLEESIAYVNARPRPLSFYLFDHDHARTEAVLDSVVAGNCAVNDTVLQFVQHELPFGGVGASGMGSYHGHRGFLTFSHTMPVFYQARMSGMSFLRPPYRGLADQVMRFLTR